MCNFLFIYMKLEKQNLGKLANFKFHTQKKTKKKQKHKRALNTVSLNKCCST